jgi:hypothetical protein
LEDEDARDLILYFGAEIIARESCPEPDGLSTQQGRCRSLMAVCTIYGGHKGIQQDQIPEFNCLCPKAMREREIMETAHDEIGSRTSWKGQDFSEVV